MKCGDLVYTRGSVFLWQISQIFTNSSVELIRSSCTSVAHKPSKIADLIPTELADRMVIAGHGHVLEAFLRKGTPLPLAWSASIDIDPPPLDEGIKLSKLQGIRDAMRAQGFEVNFGSAMLPAEPHPVEINFEFSAPRCEVAFMLWDAEQAANE